MDVLILSATCHSSSCPLTCPLPETHNPSQTTSLPPVTPRTRQRDGSAVYTKLIGVLPNRSSLLDAFPNSDTLTCTESNPGLAGALLNSSSEHFHYLTSSTLCNFTLPSHVHKSTMEDTQISGFPIFGDGDVKLVVSNSQVYHLHSSTLRRRSPFFASQFDAKPGFHLTSSIQQAGGFAYAFKLQKEFETDVGVFVRIKLKINRQLSSPRHLDNLLEFSNGKTANRQLQYWDMLFGIFYHHPPAFSDENLATVLTDVMGLIDVAESIGSVDAIREIVDLALMRQDGALWTSIAANPIAWVNLGRRVHSPTIFKESVCHIVGKWRMFTEEQKNEILHEDTRIICEKKFQELEYAKAAIEMRILGHYPAFLTRQAATKPSRPNYGGDIYMWMAIAFYRQWFAQAISDGRNRVNVDGGYEFYTQLSKGGDAYLDHEHFVNFHMYFPMSSKACNVLETNMGILKEQIKPFVEDITKERTHVKAASDNIKWLTCAVITGKDFPWNTVDTASPEATIIDDEEDTGDILPARADINGNRKSHQMDQEDGDRDADGNVWVGYSNNSE